jgi:hypothetical protein
MSRGQLERFVDSGISWQLSPPPPPPPRKQRCHCCANQLFATWDIIIPQCYMDKDNQTLQVFTCNCNSRVFSRAIGRGRQSKVPAHSSSYTTNWPWRWQFQSITSQQQHWISDTTGGSWVLTNYGLACSECNSIVPIGAAQGSKQVCWRISSMVEGHSWH